MNELKELRYFINFWALLFFREELKEEYRVPFYKYFSKEGILKRKIIKALYSYDIDNFKAMLCELWILEEYYIEVKDKDRFKTLYKEIRWTMVEFKSYEEKIRFYLKKLYKNKTVLNKDVNMLNKREDYDLDPLLEILPRVLKSN